MRNFLRVLLPLLLLLSAGSFSAAENDRPATLESVAVVQRHVDYIWALLASVLVIFMKTGFAMLELGCTRSKNAINILMKNFLDFCAVSIVFLFVGYPLMFGDSYQGLFGNNGFDLWKGSGREPVWIFWLFQLGFAGVAATIVSGAIAERTKFHAYVIFAGVFALCIYPIYGHWAWGGGAHAFLDGVAQPHQMGWLQRLGFRDFAGGSVVHEVGGACALAAIMVVGPRFGRFDGAGNSNLIAGHNMPFAALGTFILWIGWYGFNAGSTLTADAGIGRIAVNTTMAPCLGAMAAMLSMWKVQGRPDLLISLNGALAGLVAITPACANVNVGASLVIGAVAGLLVTYATILLEKLQLDDAVGAVPVHLVNGFWGILAVELFDESGFQVNEFMVQLTGAVVAPVFAFGICWILFKVLAATIGVRASDVEQDEGLDFHEHAANAYPDFHASGD